MGFTSKPTGRISGQGVRVSPEQESGATSVDKEGPGRIGMWPSPGNYLICPIGGPGKPIQGFLSPLGRS